MARRWIGATALLLAGCAGGGERIVRNFPGEGIQPGLATSFFGGSAPLEVAGAPPDGASAEAVAASFQPRGGVAPTVFRPAPLGGGGRRIVLEFGVAGSSSAACATPRGTTTAPLVVTATFCSGPQAISSATLRSDSLTGPTSDGWSSAMTRLLTALFETRPLVSRGGE